jgi:hypothetical protein
MGPERPFRVLLGFGVGDLALGVVLLALGHGYSGVVLVLVGSVLVVASFRPRVSPGGPDRIHLSPYAFQYAMVGAAFVVLAIGLFGAARSFASDGEGAKGALAVIGGVLALIVGIGAGISLVAARRIAEGRAGRSAKRWLPGWRLFVQEPGSRKPPD